MRVYRQNTAALVVGTWALVVPLGVSSPSGDNIEPSQLDKKTMSTIKFNAGKVEYDEETKRCIPLPHKGSVTISPRPEEENFYTFNWTQKTPEDGFVEPEEFLIIPGDVGFKQVKSCKTGRVLSLTFLSSGAKHLYWLQDIGDDEELDKLTEKDVDLLRRINELFTPGDEDEDEDPVEEKPQPSQAFPITDLEHAFPFEVIAEHLAKLSDEELVELVKDDLPPSIAANPTRSQIMELIRSGFFQQTKSNLSGHLKKGAGFILAQTFGLEYAGEGVGNFLEAIRRTKKDQNK